MDKKEKTLEHKFSNVLTHVEAKTLLADIELKATTIRGAITRFCRKEKQEKPETFVEMSGKFIPDFMDFWMDANPEIFEIIPESKIYDAVEKYLAFTCVWKKKVKKNYILVDKLQLQASTLLVVKNSLAASIKAVLSYNKRQPKIEQEKLIEAMPKMFQKVLPIIHAMQNGLPLPEEDQISKNISKLIGSYMANDKKTVLELFTENKTKEIDI